MRMTIDEFLVADLPQGKSELVRGEVRSTPPAEAPHGRAATNLVVALAVYVKERRLGWVFGDAVGYELARFPHTVRVPDASLVRADRIPSDGVRPGLFRFPPDLAIEVLSPSETATLLEEKIRDYATSGTRLIWIVDPMRRTILTIPDDAPVSWLSEGDTLDGGTVVPGFSCPVAEVFEGIAREA
jgi:Uma2 family endonuclease